MVQDAGATVPVELQCAEISTRFITWSRMLERSRGRQLPKTTGLKLRRSASRCCETAGRTDLIYGLL